MQNIVVLYDKEDVFEFNKYNKSSNNVYLFSPGLEIFLKNSGNINIFRPQSGPDSELQKRVIINSKKIYQEFDKNLHLINKVDDGIIENIHNIFCVSTFSFMYLVECLKKYKNFKLIYQNKFHEFNDFESFIILFIKKVFFKDNQEFFKYLRSSKFSKIKRLLIKISNQLCKLTNNNNNKLIVGSLLSKKIFEQSYKKVNIFQLKPHQDFKIYHIFLNIFSFCNFFKKKKIFYLFPVQDDNSTNKNYNKDIQFFFDSFQDKNFDYFKKVIIQPILKYCKNQTKLENSISKFVDFINPRFVLVDQLRFGVSTLLASICLTKKKNVILVPHGSISVPADEFSEFVLPICARGLIFSKIANYSVAQSKISYEAIKYYDSRIKILKSKPILFGKNILSTKLYKKSKFTFLHASTPKSLSKWPWIYENYNEYIDNINALIDRLKFKNNIELIIRFREGPECDLETFKKLININKNEFVKISTNDDFFVDLYNSDCLISFSSTSIEEALFLNKKVLIYSSSRKYKHINYKFKADNDIIYADHTNIDDKLKTVLTNDKVINYEILWVNNFSKQDDFREFYL